MKSKRLLLALALALLVPWAANAQTPLFSEDFEGGTMPAGWTTDGSGSWSVGVGDYSTSTGAGHGSYNAKITHGTTGNVTKLITPEIDLSTVASAELSFMHVQRSWAGDIDELRVYYRTSSSEAWTMLQEYTNAYGSWTTEEGIALPNPSSTYQIAFEHTDNYGYGLGIDAVSILPPATCPKPTGLNVALTPGDGTVATLSWTSDADAWQICLNGDETNLIPATTNPYPLTGLTPETTYTAKVRTNCGSEQSDWSNEVTFKPTNAYQLTVNDGTTTNGYVPIYGYYVDDITKSQFIIPAENLADMAWGTINKMTFYASNSSVNWGNAQFEVYMTETDETTLSELADYSTMTKVMNAGSLSISGNQMVVEFDTPYQYMGGNLMIGFLQTVSGSWSSCSWYGVSATGASMGGYGSSIYQQNFLPKTTFDYEPGEEPACMWPTNLAVSNVTAHTAELSWTSDGTAWQIGYSTDGFVTEQYVEVTENPYTLTGLDPETDYEVRVQKNCGGGTYSVFCTPVSFTTDALCHTPLNLYADEITAYTAHLSWEGVETTYDLRYAVLPTTRNTTKTVKLTDIINLSSADYNANQQVSAASNARPNGTRGEQLRDGWYYYDNGTFYTSFGASGSMFWATMFPAGTFTENVLTKIAVYEAASYQQPMTVYVCDGETAPENVLYAEEFEVVAGNDFHIVTLADPVIIDPSQNLWLVFHSSDSYPAAVCQYASADENDANNRWCSFDGSTWYDLADVGGAATYGWMIRAYVETIDIDNLTWVEVPSLEAFEYDMTDLTPETHYIAQVRANCGTENGVSNWITTTFTTDPTCLIPTNLAVVGLPTAHTVTLSWTENGDATSWDVEVVGPYTTTWTATENPYTVVGLEPDTEYSFRVRARCSDTDFSEWSTHVTAVTDIACYAPTNLAVANITGFAANLSWQSDASSCDLRYAPNIENEGDSWLVYDDGVYATSIGSSAASTRTWAVMYPASMLDGNTMLSMLSIYENSYIESNITINIYQGGETAPETLLYTEVVVPMNAGFHNVPLTEPVTIDPTQNLWIALTATGPYVMPACAVNDANNRWICTDGVWQELTSSLPDYGWMIRAYVGGALDWVNVTGLTENAFAMANLEPETDYIVQVRSNCEEEGYSLWTEASFTTDIACPAPTALGATPYALSAELSWEGISESYIVSYRTAAYTQGFSEEFATSSAPTGWTRSNTLLTDDVLNGTTALATYNGGWNFGTSNGVFDSHARVNIYGTSCKYWLVTPAMEVPAGAVFSFDMALTAYSGTNVPAPALTGTDDKFVVLVSTDEMASWTILRQWDNADSEYVYNNIANTATGENVSFDFSAYAGQTVYVAFYGESTTSNADNNLHIDNVAIGTPMPAGEWMTVNVDEATATLTGLTPETKYEWKVQGDCGEWGMSEESAISSFTTTNDACPVPTNLAVNAETLTATTADLSWEGSPDVESFTVRYRVPEHVVGDGLNEQFGTTTPSGWTMYTGLLSNVMEDPTALVSATSGWNFGTGNNVFDNHARCNIYGNYQRWLVTPVVTLENSTFTFDMALTVWSSSSSASPTPGNQPDDKFVVLVSTDNLATWTILRQWDNAGSEYVYDSITNDANGEHVSIDLSAYVGQTVQIAFYGESTVSNGDNNLHIDNVVIGNVQTIPATDWMTVENITDMNVTLTGLTPETPYEAQVKADCSDPEAWSNTVSFTTLEQTTLTQTIALATGTNWVSFYVDVTLNDLKAALVEVSPSATIKIIGQNSSTTYDPQRRRWSGNLQWNVAYMYKISVAANCEVSFEGMPLDPAEHPVTIVNGTNYIAFPFAENMSLTNAFAGFAVNGDKVLSQNSSATYNRGRWQGSGLTNLEPGKGYIYKSSTSGDRTLVFPSNAK